MASSTRKLRRNRKVRDRRKGSARKARLRREGTTPPFAIHPDKADQGS